MKVEDWMTEHVSFVDPGTELSRAETIMDLENIEQVPIVDDNRVVGMLTKNDIDQFRSRFGTGNNENRLVPAKFAMSENVISVHPDDLIQEVCGLFHNARIDAAPVVDDENKLVGIITKVDIYEAFMSLLGIDDRGNTVSRSVPDLEKGLENIRKITRSDRVKCLMIYGDSGSEYVLEYRKSNEDVEPGSEEKRCS